MCFQVKLRVADVTLQGCLKVVGCLLVLFLCMEVLVQRAEIGQDVHIYNVLYKGLVYAKYNEPCIPSHQPKVFHTLRTILRHFHEVTQDNGVTYWLEFGTMLGASRSGKFIPWDHDLDVGTIREEFMPKLPAITTALKRRGYILQTTDGCKYFIQSTTKDVHGANIVFRFEVFFFTLATRAQQLVFYRQYSTQFAKLRIEEVSTKMKSLATSSPLSSETVSLGHFANTPILTRCNLLDYWRYSIPKSYVDDLVEAEFEGIKSFVPRQMEEVLRLYRYPHSYWFSLPYKVNCYFTRIEYMWLPTSAIFAMAIIILLVTKLCAMFKSKKT